MGGWQRDELRDKPIVYLIAMQNGGTTIGSDELPSIGALRAWRDSLNFSATHLLLDPGWNVIERYWAANPSGNYSQAVTAIIDRKMKIRRIGDTYDSNHQLNLELLLKLVDEK